MKCLVVHESGTGFTKQYAEWIAEKISCEAKPLKKVKAVEAAEMDMIIFGGWIMGNMIMGLSKLQKMVPKQLVVFATGSSQTSNGVIERIVETNHLGDLPFFYMEGGFRHEQLGFMKKMMLSMVRKSIAKKTDKTEEDLYMEKALGASFDHSDKKYIEELVTYILNISNL